MTTYYPLYVLPTYNLPVVYPDWTTSLPTIYSPVSVVTPQMYTSLCPYTGTILAESVAPVVTCVPDLTCVPDVSYVPDITCVPDVIVTDATCNLYYAELEETGASNEVSDDPENCKYQTKDPVELFISLPKELFPSARSQAVDPNPIIDQLCQLPNINSAVNWILDLEFGISRVPVTRSIAVYNVKKNNVFCKNSLRVHPGFDTCSGTFKEVVLDYYKRIMYQWFKGYVIMNHDKSLENFQAWLVIPMNIFGMGWR